MIIISPMEIVGNVILKHIQDVFQFNYEKGNFYLDPEKDMYIRADYPEEDVGFKPGFTLKSLGGLVEEVVSLGDQPYIPQDPRIMSTITGFDAVYSGSVTLRAASQIDKEASNLAYLAMISINQFNDWILGKEGIIDVHCMGFGDAYPYEVGSYNDLFACDLQVRYAKREAFSKRKQGTTLEGVNTNIKFSFGRNE